MTSSRRIENAALFKNSQGILQFISHWDPSFMTVYLLLPLLHTISTSESYTVHQPSILKLTATSGLRQTYVIQQGVSYMTDWISSTDRKCRFKCGWTGMQHHLILSHPRICWRLDEGICNFEVSYAFTFTTESLNRKWFVPWSPIGLIRLERVSL